MSEKKGKLVDFDAFWAESQPDEAEAPRIKVFGKEHILPASPPAIMMVRALRLQGKDEDVPAEDVIKFAEALFGRETLDGWLERGLRISQIGDLVRMTMEMYHERAAGTGEGGDEENPTTPNRATRRAQAKGKTKQAGKTS